MEVTTGPAAAATVRVPIRSSAPEGWRHVRLTEVARLESGHTPSKRQPEYWGGTIPWVSLHDTEGLDAWEIHTTSQNITEAGLANSSARLLPRGTVVFSRTATVGKSTVMGRAMATSQDFACYVCGPEVHNFYLALLLRSMRAEWKKLMAGSIHNTVYMPVFKTLAVDLPPHDEQVAIASAIRDVEQMIDSLEQLLTKKRQIKQGAMQELLTGKRRLPGFAGLVQTVQLGSVCKMQSGGTPAASQSAYFDGPHPWVAISDITQANKYLSTTERSLSDAGLNASAAQLFPAGTVLYAMYASVGECCIATVTSCTSQAILAMQPTNRLDSEYLYYSLISSKAKAKSAIQQGTQGNLNKGIVQAMDIRLPEIAEQQAIARVLSEMDIEITALDSRLTKVRALKQAMAQALLTGRIRLVEPTARA